MAFSDYWRSNRDDWNSSRDHRRESQDDGSYRRGSREGSDYYGNDPQRYGSGNYDSFEDRQRNHGDRRYADADYSARPSARPSDTWRDFERSRYTRDAMDPKTAFNDRWENSYGQDSSGNFGRRSDLGGFDYEGRSDFLRSNYENSPHENYRRDTLWNPHDRPRQSQFGEQQGQHRGRGPKGYRRSDDRIREDVCEYLTDDHSVDATHIDVAVKDGEVTLSGSVNSREAKRRAESLLDRISGVADIHNRLRVTTEGLASAGKDAAAASLKGENRH